tara:strand:+ start:78 stop:386 length:309 start_codon:yes stop_codon:yes gene_type:complete
MIAEILLGISIIINGFAVWYIRELLVRFRFYSENTGQLFINLQEYTDHLERVNQMEVYFGDPTIQGLLEHSRDVTVTVAEYLDIFSLEEEDLDAQEEEEEKE